MKVSSSHWTMMNCSSCARSAVMEECAASSLLRVARYLDTRR